MPSKSAYVTMKGDKLLIKKFKRLPRKEGLKGIRKGTRIGQKMIHKQAKANAPVDTGQTKRGIKVRALKRSTVRVGHRTQVGIEAFQGDTFYAKFQEYGWRSTGGKQIAGKHFLEEASDSRGKAAANAAVDEMKKQLTALARKN